MGTSVSVRGESDVSRKWALVLTEASVSISGEWALVSAGVSVGDERALVLVRESVVQTPAKSLATLFSKSNKAGTSAS